ncbi:MAG: hypothetical protein FWD21_01180, partial [Peptococcaceae bacterium]|nr:hypothetical protein [Peptococcaceae bacterium]
GFEKTIYFNKTPQYEEDPYSVIAAWKEILPVVYFDQNSLPFRNSNKEAFKTNTLTYDHALYQIEVFLDPSIGESELLKMINVFE